jgi:ATP-dependent Clp protease ATP-binding subunit ClpA
MLEEKRRMGHDYLGAEHLLLAVLRHIDNSWAEPEPAADLLERLGVDLRKLRQEVLCRVSTEPERRRVQGQRIP